MFWVLVNCFSCKGAAGQVTLLSVKWKPGSKLLQMASHGVFTFFGYGGATTAVCLNALYVIKMNVWRFFLSSGELQWLSDG